MCAEPITEEQEFELVQYLDGQLSPSRAKRLEERLARAPELRQELDRYAGLQEQLSAAAEQSPAEIRWEAVTFTSGETIVLRGTSQALPEVYEFAASLKNSPLFTSVEPRRVTKRSEGEQDATDFELACTFAGGSATP